MSVNPTQVWHEVRPGAPWDPEGLHAAELLAAYSELEDARDSRRRLFRAGLIVAIIGCVLQALTHFLSRTEFLTVLIAIITVGAMAAVTEWRAENRLGSLTGRR